MAGSSKTLTIALVSLVAFATSCDRRSPKMSEEDLREMQATLPGMTSDCMEKARYGDIDAISSLAVNECFEMSPARRFRGIWRNEFEGSRFCPEPAIECGYDAPGDDIWLSYSRSLRNRQKPREGDGSFYQIEFVGRMTAHRGHYAHFGMSDHEVVVDEIISLHPSAISSGPN